MKRTTIKSLTIEANEMESSDYSDVLLRDIELGNYSQLHNRLGSMSKKELLIVISDNTWEIYNNEAIMVDERMKLHKYAVKALEDKL